MAIGFTGRSIARETAGHTQRPVRASHSTNAVVRALPPPGEVAAISGPGTDSPGTLADVIYRSPAGPGSGPANEYFANWTSGCYAKDDGVFGSLVFCSGGDADYWGNEVYKFSLDTRTWSRECARSSGLSGERADANFDYTWGEHRSPGGSPPPQPGVPHDYDQVEYLPSHLGGGPRGSFMFCTRTVVYRVAAFRHPHVFDLDARTWRRGSATAGIVTFEGQNDAPSWFFDSSRNRYWGIMGGEDGKFISRLHYLDFDPKTGMAKSGHVDIPRHLTPRHLPFSRHWPSADLMLIGGWNRAGTGFDLRACPLATPSVGFTSLALTGDSVPLGRYGFAYCDDLDCFFVRMAAGHRQILWKIEPPASRRLTDTWVVTEIKMRGATVAAKGNPQGMWKRFMYVPPLKCLVWVDDVHGAVYAYRPAGT